MKHGLKARWAKRPRLSRGWRVVRNLAVTAVALAAIWSMAGCPLPSAELEFRRMERRCMLPESELVFATPERYRSLYAVSGRDRTVTALDGTEITLEDCHFVGVTEELAVVGQVERGLIWAEPGSLRGYARDGQPLLLPLGLTTWPFPRAYWVTVEQGAGGGTSYTYHNVTPLVLLDVPEETRRAELSLELRAEEETLPYEAVCWDMGGGVWLAGAFREDEARPDRFAGGTYTLRLYDQAGELLLEQEGAVPQPL